MAQLTIRKRPLQKADGFIRFTLPGFVALCLALGLAGVLAGYGLLAACFHSRDGRSLLTTILVSKYGPTGGHRGPWGELVEYQIELERPTEFLQSEADTNRVAAWNFTGLSQAQARAVMLSSGLTPEQVEQALSSASAQTSPGGTTVRPDAQLIYDLTPETRSRLYQELAHLGGNHYMEYPFTFRAGAVQRWLEDSGLPMADVERVQKLFYQRGTAECFSDLATVLSAMPVAEQRVKLVASLCRQSVILPRLRIRPDSDINQLLAYWGHGAQTNELRPMLESLKRLPDGGTLSLAYVLPHFVRERVYTYPTPATKGVTMDCHWSTMNFFSDEPDNRFGDPVYTTQFLKSHYHVVAKPERFGDVVLLLNNQGNAIHSAVYVADNIVFTKNGNNNMQAWMLMKLDDLLATYASDVQHPLAVYRNNAS